MTKPIEVEGLDILLGGAEIIRGVAFSIREGEFVSIVGESGAGKSTILHALGGFIPYKGRAAVSGRIGVVFQSHSLYPWLTAIGNVRLGVGLSGANGERSAREYLKIVGLDQHLGKYPAQLSGGQVQRVAFARALASKPDILLLDEPFGALDLFTRERMQQWLLELWEDRRTTTLFVTHSVDEALLLSDRVLVMADGRVFADHYVNLERPRSATLRFEGAFLDLRREVIDSMRAASEGDKTDE